MCQHGNTNAFAWKKQRAPPAFKAGHKAAFWEDYAKYAWQDSDRRLHQYRDVFRVHIKARAKKCMRLNSCLKAQGAYEKMRLPMASRMKFSAVIKQG